MIDVEMLRPTADEMLSGLSADEAMKQRMLFRAGAMEKLPAVAGEMLAGLHATPALRNRILVKADRIDRARQPDREKETRRRPALTRMVPAAGMALVMALMIGLGVNYGGDPAAMLSPTRAPIQDGLATYQAGGTSETGGTLQYTSLYAGEGVNPPLIGVNGRFYRMLNVTVSPDVIGTQIAEVQDFTEEPSLATTVGVVSNVVQAGGKVFGVDGISTKTACIAEVDGTPRLFQRVGYAGTTFIGNELFEDTFDVYDQVAAVELSGVGVVTDEAEAKELIYLLSEFAVFSGTDTIESDQALTVYLHNGLSLQLMVHDESLSGCGVWVCPEFFEAFPTSESLA